MIERKTAVLFAAATRLGGAARRRAGGAGAKRSRDYGLNLGFAFQIADDVLDYVSDAGTLGKNIGDDLAEGKATLPLIYAIERAPPAQAASAAAARSKPAAWIRSTTSSPRSATPAQSSDARDARRNTPMRQKPHCPHLPHPQRAMRCTCWPTTPCNAITEHASDRSR